MQQRAAKASDPDRVRLYAMSVRQALAQIAVNYGRQEACDAAWRVAREATEHLVEIEEEVSTAARLYALADEISTGLRIEEVDGTVHYPEVAEREPLEAVGDRALPEPPGQAAAPCAPPRSRPWGSLDGQVFWFFQGAIGLLLVVVMTIGFADLLEGIFRVLIERAP